MIDRRKGRRGRILRSWRNEGHEKKFTGRFRLEKERKFSDLVTGSETASAVNNPYIEIWIEKPSEKKNISKYC